MIANFIEFQGSSTKFYVMTKELGNQGTTGTAIYIYSKRLMTSAVAITPEISPFFLIAINDTAEFVTFRSREIFGPKVF